jgi:hypothetical protein
MSLSPLGTGCEGLCIEGCNCQGSHCQEHGGPGTWDLGLGYMYTSVCTGNVSCWGMNATVSPIQEFLK